MNMVIITYAISAMTICIDKGKRGELTMKQYLVVTKGKSYLIDADKYDVKDVQDGRKSIYRFAIGKELIASFDVSDVKAIIKQ